MGTTWEPLMDTGTRTLRVVMGDGAQAGAATVRGN